MDNRVGLSHMGDNRRYYVVWEAEKGWLVMLEEGPNLEVFGTDRQGAINRAKEMGRRNNRGVWVNYKSGATGAQTYTKDEL